MEAVNFVAESMIGNECINITAPEIAMEAYADRSNFKLYMGDTGLLVTQILQSSEDTEMSIYKSLIFDNLGINQGMILENMVGQMLRATDIPFISMNFYIIPRILQKKKSMKLIL